MRGWNKDRSGGIILSRRLGRHRALRPVIERVEGRLLLSADIFTVSSTGGTTAGTGTSGTLPYVLALADADPNPDGSEIMFDNAVFSSSSPSTITVSNTLVLSRTSGPMVIDEPTAGAVTVSGGHAVEVFDIDSSVNATISGLTITGGSATRGAGVISYGNLTLTDCTITGNSAHGGTTSNTGGGGGLLSFGPATLTGCMITDNSAFDGGALDDFNTTLLTGCMVSGNLATNNGGGLFIDEGSTTLGGCTIGSNSAEGIGGGLANDYATATLTGCTISANSAAAGGAGLDNIRSNSTLTLSDCTISDNSTPGAPSIAGGGSAAGGGLDNTGSATLTDCAILDNYGQEWGGGLDNFHDLALTNCTLSGNVSQYGAGLFNDEGSAVLTNCTLAGNSATLGGGGLLNDYATATLTRCTISGNTAGNGTGGGLDNARNGETATLTDSIVAGNFGSSSAADIYNNGNLVGSYNLTGVGGPGGLTNGASGNLDLGPLANNGGPTDTMALLPGSAAIQKGSVISGVTTDERGEPLDSPPDIGAYQVQQPAATTDPASAVASASATLNATVDPEDSAEPVAWFAYGTSPTLTTSTPTQQQSISGGSSSEPVSAALTGLSPDTTYYYQIILEYHGGTTGGLILSFTTATPISSPASTTEPATGVISTTATLNASVNPQGSATTVSFVYGTTSTLATGTMSTGGQSIGNGTTSISVTAAPVGLAPSTTYYYKVVATNAGGTTDGSILSFTTATPISPPAATTGPATGVNITAATINASVNPQGSATTVSFVYGTTSTLATGTISTGGQSIGNGTASIPVTAALAGLSPSTTYYYEVVATNAGGTTDGSILSFTAATPISPPLATTGPATGVTSTTATMNASLNPQGSATTVSFLYGTTSTLATGTISTGGQSIGNGTTSISVTTALVGLAPSTTYYYEVVATNAGGATDGSILSFTTNSAASPVVNVNPVYLTYGTPLANSQLSGSATVTVDGGVVSLPGSFTYTSLVGWVLSAGEDRLGAMFTPADSVNYRTVITTVNVNIAPAALTVTAADQSMTYGSEVPSLAYSYTGLVNGDTRAAFTGSLATTATPSSPPGSYPISEGDLAATGNYTIGTFNPATLTVMAAPVTVEGISIQRISVGRHKTAQVIVLNFSGALNAGDADSLVDYSLVTVAQGKKRSRGVALSGVYYNGAGNTLTLTPVKKLTLSPPLLLTVYSRGVLDTIGRPIDGGASVVAILSKGGATIESAAVLGRAGKPGSDAVDTALGSNHGAFRVKGFGARHSST